MPLILIHIAAPNEICVLFSTRPGMTFVNKVFNGERVQIHSKIDLAEIGFFCPLIDLLAIYKRVWIERYFYTYLYAKFDRVTLGRLSLLCTFENSSECKQTSFD